MWFVYRKPKGDNHEANREWWTRGEEWSTDHGNAKQFHSSREANDFCNDLERGRRPSDPETYAYGVQSY